MSASTLPENRIAMTEAERIGYGRAHRSDRYPELTYGHKLMQRCPDCGRVEVAHPYCSFCFLPMGPEDWYVHTISPRQKAAISKARSLSPRGHNRAIPEAKSAKLGGRRPTPGPSPAISPLPLPENDRRAIFCGLSGEVPTVERRTTLKPRCRPRASRTAPGQIVAATRLLGFSGEPESVSDELIRPGIGSTELPEKVLR